MLSQSPENKDLKKRSLPNFIEGYLQYTDNTEAPESYRRWTAVSVVAAALQRKVKLDWGHYLYPNMYILLVGPAGKARKGTAMSPAQNLLHDTGIKLAANTTTRAALIRRIKQTNKNDSSLGPIYNHASLTVFSKEFTVFLGYNNVQLMADLCDLYDCDDHWEYDTKDITKRDSIDNVWLNIIGASTPQSIQSALPLDVAGGGLLSRIVTVYEEDKGKVVVFPHMSKEQKGLYAKLRSDLEVINMLVGEYTMNKEAMEVYKEFYLKNESDPPFQGTILESYITRRQTNLLKLGMILSASRDNELVIEPGDIKTGISMLETAEAKMMNAYRGLGAVDHSEVMNRMMMEIGRQKTVAKSQLIKKFMNDADIDLVEKIILTLETIGFCKTKVQVSPPDVIITYIPEENDEPTT